MEILKLIAQKRDGGELAPAQISWLIEAYMDERIPDYQMSAWLMAALTRGLSFNETLALTDALVDSGQRIDLSSLNQPVMDKHSTGGVGDKVTLVLAPVIGACGAIFGKMSGRALGHTGGTIDKLESIPGYRADLDAREFLQQLVDTGVCVTGQSPTLVPADKRLYALRDLTGTVASPGLVASSVMSKKIAAGAAAVALDVKVGRGAFFRSRGQASGVAHLMNKIGEARGVRTEVLLTSMEQPLGLAIGNSLEIREAVTALKGSGPLDLVEVVVQLAARLLPHADLGWKQDRSEIEARQVLSNGAALKKFREWMDSQGADTGFIDDPEALPLAPFSATVTASRSGFISGIDAMAVGWAVQRLGAGRRRPGEPVDAGVGVLLAAKTGDPVSSGQTLATVWAHSQSQADAAATLVSASYEYQDEPATPPPLILK